MILMIVPSKGVVRLQSHPIGARRGARHFFNGLPLPLAGGTLGRRRLVLLRSLRRQDRFLLPCTHVRPAAANYA